MDREVPDVGPFAEPKSLSNSANSLFQGARILLLMSHRQKRKVNILLLCVFLIVLTIGQKRNHSTGDELLLLKFKKLCIKLIVL